MNSSRPPHVSILGGGPAGLYAGYLLSRDEIPITVYEAKNRVGGNCVTYQHRDFLFDSGAHRLHDKDRSVTGVVESLLGSDLLKTTTSSQIFYRGRFVDFPLAPAGLVRHLGIAGTVRAAAEVLRSRLRARGRSRDNFQNFALNTYGRTIAERFLLTYSEKLWGVPCEKISASMAKTRLKGLNLKTFLRETTRTPDAEAEHFEGVFYYPKYGIGMIADRLGEFCGAGSLRTNATVTGISHDGKRIRSVTINGSEEIEVDDVVSTLPLPFFVRILDPPPDAELLTLSENLHFRSLILVAFFLNRGRISSNATTYFPESEFVFTRAYEPGNRSPFMNPEGKTSLVMEIACDLGDVIWRMKDEELISLVLRQLSRVKWMAPDEIIGSEVRRMEHAYPVLRLETEEATARILDHLEGFENLEVAGRNARFTYSSIHEVLASTGEALVRTRVAAGRAA